MKTHDFCCCSFMVYQSFCLYRICYQLLSNLFFLHWWKPYLLTIYKLTKYQNIISRWKIEKATNVLSKTVLKQYEGYAKGLDDGERKTHIWWPSYRWPLLTVNLKINTLSFLKQKRPYLCLHRDILCRYKIALLKFKTENIFIISEYNHTIISYLN